ncbi:hypothetical protein HK413_03460 [Mucilaginibacter sp. S1162]|uniref:Uncharacterized protein n=1 Tax=Mucilaginibacter humi TaxID=2732510 RepID=A0ABX1W2L2_9SPHI|nr:hypothetical protein [Mucilaginibacter humi]NNU33454.1 hypothetical protein [Mucilaginibacter humi]
MEYYHQNASVVYTDNKGRQIDTFVIFDTDRQTGLTHINHENLKVPADRLALHAKTVCQYHLPIDDAFSFEMIKKLRQKYADIDRKVRRKEAPKEMTKMLVLAKAS